MNGLVCVPYTCFIMKFCPLLGYVIEDDNPPPGPSQDKVQAPSKEVKAPTQEELRQKRLAFLQRLDQTAKGTEEEGRTTEPTDPKSTATEGVIQPEGVSQPEESQGSPQEEQMEKESKEGILSHLIAFDLTFAGKFG